LNRWVLEAPEHPALVESSHVCTYSQLAQAVSTTREWLHSLGVRPGDRVMIVGENCRAFVIVLLATTAMDAWPVLVNARLSARELDEIREHSQARRIIFTTSVSSNAAEHAAAHNAVFEERDGIGTVAFGPLHESAECEPLDPDISERVAALIYTSGTTGRSKGVMLTHRNLLFMAEGSAAIRSVNPGDRVFGALPMSHAVGLATVLLGSLIAGATVYLVPRFDPMTARTAIEKEAMTLLYGTPAIFNQFLQYANLRRLSSLKFPSLRIITASGAPLDPGTKAAIEALFGMSLHNGYGVTECSPTIATTRPERPLSNTSVGELFPGVEVKLIDDQGGESASGEIGELRVRGPNVMKGYYRAPDETAAVIDLDGWFNTRDLARRDGPFLDIVGRTKDLIIHRGFNVYPAEVEAVLNRHPYVQRSAVIGRTVAGDEQVVAFVEPLSGCSLTASDLVEYSAQHLASYKRPSQFVLLPTMPITLTGKVIKGELPKLAGLEAW
jgi:acyl-CoA synthetase (AMP-forming)/AMP-acid ligase II